MQVNRIPLLAWCPVPDQRQQVKDAIWDQVKLVDPGFKDLTLDLSVAAGTGGAANAGQAQPRTYTVQSGDTLSRLAERFYGDRMAYMRIFEANRGVLKYPDRIYPGQVLTIPS